uniref:Calcium-activated chloride channel N-terminal domain-containing protein n=1 Tax=Salvator merianae TaxID=96440 RepID=A0A8D0DVE4_SALMN
PRFTIKWLLFLTLQMLHGGGGSIVKLNSGGFEDIVIAINPRVPEDERIIANIKVRFQSKDLVNTKCLLFCLLLHVKEYSVPFQADIIVADPYLKYGDHPYTLQYGGCGEQGPYIHFTPDFLTNDSFLSVYGSRGRTFVHEWAHFRWGVFDEYNRNAPFYATGPRTAEATRCSAGISGQYILPLSTVETRPCKIEHRTGLYEPGCQFIPDKVQSTSASIMYMQGLPSVSMTKGNQFVFGNLTISIIYFFALCDL